MCVNLCVCAIMYVYAIQADDGLMEDPLIIDVDL